MSDTASPKASKPSPARSRIKCALIGNPNTGKSTLFNTLAGLHTQVGNYPGVTVEKKVARVVWDGQPLELIDLPGAYSLAPRSLDEKVAIDVMLGLQPEIGKVDVVMCVLDASNLERNLYLASQVLSLQLPTVFVLNMSDVAANRGIIMDVEELESRLGVSIIPTQGHRRIGLDKLKHAVLETASSGKRPRPETCELFPAVFDEAVAQLRKLAPEETPQGMLERLLIDQGGVLEQELLDDAGRRKLAEIREQLQKSGCGVPMVEARQRYGWIRSLLEGVIQRPAQRRVTFSDRLDKVLTHRISGLLIFVLVMGVVYQAIATWSGPMMDAVEWLQELAAGQVAAAISPGPLRSLLIDGVIAGVGGVLVFTPQIAMLFFFIALLEDSGYMARAAFLMDRLMTRIGLSGKSFVPLMSSFACAIPGIMATRVIENRRDRMVTILIAPLMSCSARLPVYMLLIYTFIPATTWLGGWLHLRTLVLLAMTFLGLVVAAPVAWMLKRWVFPGEPAPLVMELPDYKLPTPRLVLHRAADRAMAFVTRAGSLIFATTILVWAAGYFPSDHAEEHDLERRIETIASRVSQVEEEVAEGVDDERGEDELARLTSRLEQVREGADEEMEQLGSRLREVRGEALRNSALGRMGHWVEPAVKPLGWDWRIGVGAIASFPAREVIIATMGTIYSLGGDVDEEDGGLKDAMRAARWPDGRPVFSVPVALSILVFFALCAQCGATLMVIWRETNHWGWPIFTFVYMTGLAYVGALLVYQVSIRLIS